MAIKNDGRAYIQGDNLVICISANNLATASEASPALEFFDNITGEFTPVVVTDTIAWMKAVANELNQESEDGTTLVHKMFDQAFERAANQGAEGIRIGDL